MRSLYWILGLLASAVGSAYVVNRRAKRRLARRFLEALLQGPFSVEVYEPSIVAPGVRAEAFRGLLAGVPFRFVGRTDASGTRWTYGLAWGQSWAAATWSPRSNETENPFQQAFLILRRRSSRDDGISK